MQSLKFPWQPLSGSIKVKCALARSDGSVLGLAEDGSQVRRVSPDSEWTPVGDGARFKFLSQLTAGGLLYVGLDEQLYALPSLWTGKLPAVPLTPVSGGGGAVPAAVQLRNGAIVGLGNDGSLVTRGSVYNDWAPIPNSGTMSNLAMLADDTIVGVGTDFYLYAWSTLTNSWSKYPNSGDVIAVQST